MENLEVTQNNVFDKKDITRDFNKSDVGKVFWRVEYRGSMTQCLIHEIRDDNKAVIRLASLNYLQDEEYKMKSEIEYYGSSTYGTDVLRGNNEYYFDLNEAKKASLERYYKEVNPNGLYRVARYFDNIFECFETDTLPKKDARIKCDELNKRPRAYVSYELKSVN